MPTPPPTESPAPDIATTSKPDDDDIDGAVDDHIKSILGNGIKLDALGTAYQCGYLDGLKAGCRAMYVKGYQKGYNEGVAAGLAAGGGS